MDFPFRGTIYSYRGRDENKRRRTIEKNKCVEKIERYINEQVANNPDEMQQLMFANIALKLGIDVEIVRHAVSDGGYNGITFRVTDEDREHLERFKKAE